MGRWQRRWPKHAMHVLLILKILSSLTYAWNLESWEKEAKLRPQIPELFSVAPMMGHTNRHYRYFYRLLSTNTYLYTEMIPATQIYGVCEQLYGSNQLSDVPSLCQRISEELDKDAPDRSPEIQFLQDLLSHAFGSRSPVGPTVLQLGGTNPQALAVAAAVGAVCYRFDEINLNCGCPSNAVGGRQGGVALMKDPEHAARLVLAMHQCVQQSATASAVTSAPPITVKHRLGVDNAATFDGAADREKDDTEAYQTCRNFVEHLHATGAVSKIHLHARLGLLGEFDPDASSSSNGQPKLWVPGEPSKEQATNDRGQPKVDHKREQYRARQRSRLATIKNRSVPPLRPKVIERLAQEYRDLEFVTNGEIRSLADVEAVAAAGRYGAQDTLITGAMVGRAAINHPCSFAGGDRLWTHVGSPQRRPTRQDVLETYLDYCDVEEERMELVSSSNLNDLRRRLVAVPFHLFVGEDGSDEFQRRITKLTNRRFTIKPRSILEGASSFVPEETLNKCIDEFVPFDQVKLYNSFQRSGSMQRVVY